MKNIIKIFIIALCLSATACANNSSSTDSVKTDSSTIEISTSSNVDSIEIDSSNESSTEFSEIDSSSISETDSSNESSETESFKVDSSETDSSKDESSKAVTTTKTTAKETAKATTTTKQTTTQPAVTAKSYVAPTTTTQKPVVTTKPAVQTTKTTTKATTKSTTKQTTKTTTSKIVKPSNLTRYEDALWEVLINRNYSKTNTKYLEIIRQEAIKYAQNGYIKQYYSALGGFEVNSKMYPFVKNGKPYYVYEKGIVNANVEFNDARTLGACDMSSTEAAISDIKGIIRSFDVLIAHQLANACRHGEPDIQWNLTYGFCTDGRVGTTEWYCITGFACEWK